MDSHWLEGSAGRPLVWVGPGGVVNSLAGAWRWAGACDGGGTRVEVLEGSVCCGCAALDGPAPSDGLIMVGALSLRAGMEISLGGDPSPSGLASGDGGPLAVGALFLRSRVGLAARIACGCPAALAGPAPTGDPALAEGLFARGCLRTWSGNAGCGLAAPAVPAPAEGLFARGRVRTWSGSAGCGLAALSSPAAAVDGPAPAGGLLLFGL